tara:strand:+ start:86 stop:454 length:369 start_codon:yes stop_codon:yes gene_type:complete
MKSFVFYLLMIFSATSYAFNWVKVFENSFRSSYVDTEKLIMSNEEVIFWTLTNYGDNNNLSSVSKYKANCTQEKNTHLYFAYYHEPMGEGRVISEDNWEKSKYPKLNSEEYDLMKFACDRAK